MKRDKNFRPVLIVNVSILAKMSRADQDNMDGVINYLLTYSVNKINLKGKSETFTIILDLANVSMT